MRIKELKLILKQNGFLHKKDNEDEYFYYKETANKK